MRDTVANGSLTITQKRESSGRDDTCSATKRRVVTTARREQNRVAQKAYRERQKQERKRLKQQKAQGGDRPRLRPLLKRGDSSVSERQESSQKLSNEPKATWPDSNQVIDTVNSQLHDAEESSESEFPDLYLNMLQFSTSAFFASCLANAVSLGFDLSRIANCSVECMSPFYQPNLCTTQDHTTLAQAGSGVLSSYNNTAIPIHLRPTMAQILIPHHVSLDLIPLPFLRERAIMLSAAMPHVFNNWELKVDIYDRGGLTIWRLDSSNRGKGANGRDSYPPWDMKSWEAAPWFLKKWCVLIGGNHDELYNQSIGWQVVRDMICSRDKLVQN
ncbi:BZIP domain-containing protein [Fusarium acuminatum]|uniref:BZIP domain-containing protein n=1 Tax=Fusarium acuminatum TaxID=5515 RepID=A0ABZ2X6I8_9HYPO